MQGGGDSSAEVAAQNQGGSPGWKREGEKGVASQMGGTLVPPIWLLELVGSLEQDATAQLDDAVAAAGFR